MNRITKGREQILNKTFIKIMDELGYDVDLKYRKKQEKPKDHAEVKQDART